MTERIEPFPVEYEASLVLSEVRSDDRVVYFESCACLPLRQQIAEKIRGRGKLVIIRRDCDGEDAARGEVECREGTYERVPLEDSWATLIIGECSLDEFKNGKEALCELSRILASGGRILLSGPVLTHNGDTLDRVIRLTPVEFLTLDKIQRLLAQAVFGRTEVVDLTSQVLDRLHSSHYRGLAEIMKKSKTLFVLLKAIKS